VYRQSGKKTIEWIRTEGRYWFAARVFNNPTFIRFLIGRQIATVLCAIIDMIKPGGLEREGGGCVNSGPSVMAGFSGDLPLSRLRTAWPTMTVRHLVGWLTVLDAMANGLLGLACDWRCTSTGFVRGGLAAAGVGLTIFSCSRSNKQGLWRTIRKPIDPILLGMLSSCIERHSILTVGATRKRPEGTLC